MNRNLLVLLPSVLMMACASSNDSTDDLSFASNGETENVETAEAALLNTGEVYLRATAEAQGFTVTWNSSTKTAVIAKGSNFYTFKADGSNSSVRMDGSSVVVKKAYFDAKIKKGYFRKYYDAVKTYVSTYETKDDETVDIELGTVNRLESLPSIQGIQQRAGKKVVVKMNGGAFNWSTQVEHSGLLFDQHLKVGASATPKMYTPPNTGYINFLYKKDGTSVIRQVASNEYSTLDTYTQWAIGSFYSLRVNGSTSINSGVPGDGNKTNSPGRTMLGMKTDGSFILAVIDSDDASGKAATANNCATLMGQLGAQNAVMLDGSGSSQMAVYDYAQNLKTYVDGDRRQIGSAIFVYLK